MQNVTNSKKEVYTNKKNIYYNIILRFDKVLEKNFVERQTVKIPNAETNIIYTSTLIL